MFSITVVEILASLRLWRTKDLQTFVEEFDSGTNIELCWEHHVSCILKRSVLETEILWSNLNMLSEIITFLHTPNR